MRSVDRGGRGAQKDEPKNGRTIGRPLSRDKANPGRMRDYRAWCAIIARIPGYSQHGRHTVCHRPQGPDRRPGQGPARDRGLRRRPPSPHAERGRAARRPHAHGGATLPAEPVPLRLRRHRRQAVLADAARAAAGPELPWRRAPAAAGAALHPARIARQWRDRQHERARRPRDRLRGAQQQPAHGEHRLPRRCARAGACGDAGLCDPVDLGRRGHRPLDRRARVHQLRCCRDARRRPVSRGGAGRAGSGLLGDRAAARPRPARHRRAPARPARRVHGCARA